jgi:hypothetical protein
MRLGKRERAARKKTRRLAVAVSVKRVKVPVHPVEHPLGPKVRVRMFADKLTPFRMVWSPAGTRSQAYRWIGEKPGRGQHLYAKAEPRPPIPKLIYR